MPASDIPKHGFLGMATMPPASDEVDLLSVVRVLWRRKALILLTAGLLTALGTIGVLSIAPRYTAEAMVAVGSRGPSAIDFETSNGNLHLDRTDPDAVVTEIEVLSARSLAKLVIDKLALTGNPEFAGEVAAATSRPALIIKAEDWLRSVGILPMAEARRAKPNVDAAVLDAFEARRRVSAKGTSRVINVSFTAHDPALAASIVNTIVQTYIAQQIEAKAAFIKTAGKWLEQRAADLRTQSASAEAEVQDYRRKNGLYVEADGTTRESKELWERTQQLLQAQADVNTTQARLTRVRALLASGVGADSMAEVLGSPLIQVLQQHASELQTQIAEMSSKLGSAAPKLQMAQAGLADLRGKIKLEVGKLLHQLENEATIAKDKAATAAKAVDVLKQQVATIEASRVQLRALEQKAEGSRTILNNFMSRFKQFSPDENKALQEPDAHIISSADVPTQPSFPKVKLMLLLVGVSAVCISALATFVVETMDRRRLRSGLDIESRIGLPVFGLVPMAARKYLPDRLAGRGKAVALTRPIWDQISQQPHSEYSEAIRRCETNLAFAAGDGRSDVVLVTSAQPKEGKTTFAISLATSAAMAGRRVLLVDADCRKPDIGRSLGLKGRWGLTDILMGKSFLDESIVRDQKTGLDIIVGEASDFRLVGASVSRLENLLTMLRSRYDLIVIDAPPVLAAAETRVLCLLADATAFVVRWANSRDAVVRLALKQIATTGRGVSGVVITMVDPEKHARYGFVDGAFYSKEIRDYYRAAEPI